MQEVVGASMATVMVVSATVTLQSVNGRRRRDASDSKGQGEQGLVRLSLGVHDMRLSLG